MVTARTVLTDRKFPTKLSRNVFINGKQPTLGAKGFSCAVSGFGQVLKSDPREKPLDLSSIPLIAPSQLQPRLYQNIQNLDVLLIGSLKISKCFKRSDWITITKGARDRDAGGLRQPKHTSRSFCFCFLE